MVSFHFPAAAERQHVECQQMDCTVQQSISHASAHGCSVALSRDSFVKLIITDGLQRGLHAAFQPNNAPPLSSSDETPEGDVYLPDGTPAKFPKPQALDKAGITQARAGTCCACCVNIG